MGFHSQGEQPKPNPKLEPNPNRNPIVVGDLGSGEKLGMATRSKCPGTPISCVQDVLHMYGNYFFFSSCFYNNYYYFCDRLHYRMTILVANSLTDL